MNAASQLAFCYKVGFGTPSNEEMSKRWLLTADQPAEDLEIEIELAEKTTLLHFQSSNLRALVRRGLTLGNTTSIRTEDIEEIELTEAGLRREIMDMEPIFGKDSRCIRKLILTLAKLLEHQQKFKEAEILRIELLEHVSTQSPDPRVPFRSSIRNSGFYRGDVYKNLLPDRPCPEIKVPKLEYELQALERIMGFADGKIPLTLDLIRGLANNYHLQERWEEAEWLYVQLRNEIRISEGELHPDTLELSGSIARLLMNQGLLLEAESLFTWVWEMQKTVLGIEHFDTRNSMVFLLDIYSLLDSAKKFETLRCLDIAKGLLLPIIFVLGVSYIFCS